MDANKNPKKNDVNSWFANKFGSQVAKVKPKEDVKINQKEKMSIGQYKNIRKQIEEQLAARRREDMQRRHRFYNADNELLNQNDNEEEEEEEEFTDEEEKENEYKGDINGKTADANAEGDVSQEKYDTRRAVDDEEDAEEMEAADDVEDDQEDESNVSDTYKEDKEAVDCDDDEMLMKFGSGDDKDAESKNKRRRRGSSQISSAFTKENSRKRPRLISSSSDDSQDGSLKNVPVIDTEPVRLAEPVPCSGNEFSHISLDLNAVATAIACSQDFNEALFLCSGTFGDTDETPMEKKTQKSSQPSDQSEKMFVNHDDLFTVEDDVKDEEAKAGAAGDDGWPIKWVDDDEREDEEQEDGNNEEIRRKPIKIKDILDDEASLSGDDVGDDSGDSDGEEDEYEPEAGDDDELPDEEVIREKLVRQYIKQTNDDDERRMIQLQEQFFADSDLHSATNMDRSFRFRMRDDTNVDWNKLLGTVEEEEKENSDNEEDQDSVKNLTEKKVEMLKWRLEMEKKKYVFNDSTNVEYVEMFESSSLLKLGEKSIGRKATKTNSAEITHCSDGHTSKESELVVLRARDSLLNKAGALRHVIKETTTTATATHSLFTVSLKK